MTTQKGSVTSTKNSQSVTISTKNKTTQAGNCTEVFETSKQQAEREGV